MTFPTERLDIQNVDDALAEINEFAIALVLEGKRPWFEVWYPNTTAENFDAIEVDPATGEITTLPPYDDEEAWA